MRRLLGIAGVFATSAVLVAACDGGGSYYGGSADAAVGGNVGDECLPTKPCRAGLTCDAKYKCAPGHSLPDGTPCMISAECKDGSYCGSKRTCEPAGAGADGADCLSDADCKSGLRCNLTGFSAKCQPDGTVDVGGACKKSGDCFGGLACADGVCATLPPNPSGPPPLGLPTWKGETCADDPGPVKAYFRVPRGTGDGDFYRLPFPNDIRTKGGHPDLTGHPSPGPYMLGFDPVDRYLRDVEQSADGFSTYPTAIFRFSGNVDFESLKAAGVVRLVDVTPAGSGDDLGYGWSATTARGKYVCENALFLRVSTGAPLLPAHTYAAIITTGVKDAKANLVAKSDDLTAVMGATAPADPTLAVAWAAYKPLRDWAVKKAVDPSTILSAAVFTTAHADRLASRLPAAIAAAAPPTATGWVRCGDGPSPCPQATGERACGAADPAFDELHALVTLPIYQKGTAPYLDPQDGGDFDLASDGTPTFQRSEQVCMALTVPKGVAMPASGWPLVIYAHGTGGSFRSAINDGVSARLANVDGAVHMAVLGIDQVQHGPRRGASTASPNDLFFNFANPKAARGNPMQGAADQVALVRFASTFDLPSGQSPTAAEIKFGATAYWGHSQGATEGAIAMPYVTGVKGAVFSGVGASLTDALLTKTSPVNISKAVPFVLQEPSAIDATHPVLGILQNDIDPADPLNHGRAMVIAPAQLALAKHLFIPFAQKDTYAPPITQFTYALTAGVDVAVPPASVTSPHSGLTSLGPKAVPLGGNRKAGVTPITDVVREYSPTSYDGHFVSFKDADGIKDVDHFLADVVLGVVPGVGR